MLIEGGLFGWFQSHSAEWRLSVRVTVAAVLAYGVAAALELPQGYWAVFTAIVVMQASVGGSVKAGIDWLVGTIGGAVVGIIVATLIPKVDAVAHGLAIVAVVAPLAFLAAVKPRFRVAPLTAVIVVLGLNPAYSPLQSALHRVVEIAIGSLIGVGVSLTVFPARAHGLAAQAAADALGVCAALANVLLEGIGTGTEASVTDPLHAALRHALTQLETLTDEAARERASRLTGEPDTGPLARTLRRLRSDLVMVNRATVAPLPEAVAASIAPAALHVGRAAVAFLSDSAGALRQRGAAPPLSEIDGAIAAYNATLASLRRDGALRVLADDALGRFYALGFALEQLHDNFQDLASRITELSRA